MIPTYFHFSSSSISNIVLSISQEDLKSRPKISRILHSLANYNAGVTPSASDMEKSSKAPQVSHMDLWGRKGNSSVECISDNGQDSSYPNPFQTILLAFY